MLQPSLGNLSYTEAKKRNLSSCVTSQNVIFFLEIKDTSPT